MPPPSYYRASAAAALLPSQLLLSVLLLLAALLACSTNTTAASSPRTGRPDSAVASGAGRDTSRGAILRGAPADSINNAAGRQSKPGASSVALKPGAASIVLKPNPAVTTLKPNPAVVPDKPSPAVTPFSLDATGTPTKPAWSDLPCRFSGWSRKCDPPVPIPVTTEPISPAERQHRYAVAALQVVVQKAYENEKWLGKDISLQDLRRKYADMTCQKWCRWRCSERELQSSTCINAEGKLDGQGLRGDKVRDEGELWACDKFCAAWPCGNPPWVVDRLRMSQGWGFENKDTDLSNCY